MYSHVNRNEAMYELEGKSVKTRWVLTEKREGLRCRFVAQEFAKGGP